MENKIQELTDKIYREGVEKGNTEPRNLSLTLKMKPRKLWKTLVKKLKQLWLPLVSLPMNWQKIPIGIKIIRRPGSECTEV